MASGSNLVSSNNAQSFECGICQELYKTPIKQLPKCGHSFCLQCLRGPGIVVNNLIKCPMCRTLSRLTSGELEELQTNYAAQDMVESFQKICLIITPPLRISQQLTLPNPEQRRKFLAAELLQTSRKGDVVHLRRLIQLGADLNTRDSYGWTALHCAAYYGRYHIAKLLLDYHFNDVNSKTCDGYTALLLACSKLYQIENVNVAKLLLENGVDVNLADKDNWTPLIWTGRWGNDELVKIMLEKGIRDANHRTNNGTTALSVALAGGHFSTAEILKSYKASC